MPQVEPEKQAELSAPSPNADRPPRLATCINEPMIEPDRTPAGDGSWALPTEFISSNNLTDIVDWVCKLLEDDTWYSYVWVTPAGDHPNPTEAAAKPDEELWAKLVEQLFLGTAYGGPDIAAEFPSKKDSASRSNYVYIYQRFYGPKASDKPAVDNPAYSLVVACQSLTTYGAVSRGATFDKDLGNNGIPASQAACSLPIFKGAWFTPGPITVDGKADPDARPITADEAHDAQLAAAKASGFGPGTVYTYNPARFTEFLLTDAREEDLQRNPDGTIYMDPATSHPVLLPAVANKKVLEAQKQTKEADQARENVAKTVNSGARIEVLKTEKTDPLKGVEDQTAPKAIPEGEKNAAGVYTAKMPIRVQLDGSHVSMILRRYTTSKGEIAVQMLDTSAQGASDVGTYSQDDYRVFEHVSGYKGIYASEGHKKVPRQATGSFVGMGTLPPVANAATMFENMTKARPVGLTRLVLAKRQADKAITEDDIYFISKMIPMWSPAVATRNFHISRLLWSLRNTPWRKDIQAYWIVYAPRAWLAEVMWEKGARKKTLLELNNETVARANEAIEAANAKNPLAKPKPDWKQLHTGRDTRPIAVLSHDEAGRALQLWRDHGLKPKGEGALPKVIREAFIETGAPPINVITRKLKELRKLFDAEQASRAKKIKEKKAELEKAKRRAQKGEPGALEEMKTIGDEMVAIQKAPYPEEAGEIIDFAKKVGDESQYGPIFICRADPQRSHAHKGVTNLQAFPVPELLR